ncbi:hypothetical protein DFO70_101105 [Cytobacillus firmus]|uniref:Uncharacterized protein n=2 Tax=Cytobacillus TaxID=2675230 RepID=A0A366K6S2_CYTFI|nr:hypothetical protein DFO70_101105 [Cytobacillus firmus]TDX45973.1 hypothetical protein DFO72_102452 [Cytobacillus oceanisediminis]
MHTTQHGIQQASQARQLAQQLIQQTQQGSQQYRMMLQQEQENIQMLEQIMFWDNCPFDIFLIAQHQHTRKINQ